MAIDAAYQDNVVLKQDAFQNLLTHIKNYPIIDIDYVGEEDEDELHGEPVWDAYTNGVPCIKITYGDERTTKGNILFAEDQRKAISDQKKIINQAQIVLNELIKRKNKWELVYKQNYALYEDKDKQVQRFKANFNKNEYDKLSFLKAGWDLLYNNSNEMLFIDDPYVIVPPEAGVITFLDAQELHVDTCYYDPNTIYYVHSNEYLFTRYNFTYDNITVDPYISIRPAHMENGEQVAAHPQYDNMRKDWAAKVRAGEIYTYSSVQDRGPVMYNKLGPEVFKYENILLNKNPYTLVQITDTYDTMQTYWQRDSSTNEFDTYMYEGQERMERDNPNFEQFEADWRAHVQAKVLYTKDEEEDVVKSFNLTYTTLGSTRASLIGILTNYKNLVDGQGNSIWTDEQKAVFEHFIDFIRAYNRLVFLDTIGIAGYDRRDIERLREENSTITKMLQALDKEDDLEDFDWESTDQWREDLDSYYGSFWREIEDNLIEVIKNVINKNLRYIRDQIRNISSSIDVQNAIVADAQEDLEYLWNNITTSAIEYVPVGTGATYNPEMEYYVKDDPSAEESTYSLYTGGGSNWANGAGKYIQKDRTVYGYKYVKVGSNILFDNTYASTETADCTLSMGQLEVNNSNLQATAQKSGTFRIEINKHLYEIPIKGFGVKSNQIINIATSHTNGININSDTSTSITSGTTLSMSSKGNTTISAKNNNNELQNIILDGNITINGIINTSLVPDDASLNLGLLDSVTPGNTKRWNYIYVKHVNVDGSILPFGTTNGTGTGGTTNTGGNLGNELHRWGNIYGYNLNSVNGSFTNLTINGNTIDSTNINSVVNGDTTNTSTVFWRGDGAWSNELTGTLALTTAVAGRKHTNDTQPNTSNYLFRANGNGYFDGNLKANKVFGAVFNDYAEYRTTINLEPGRVVIDNDDGSLKCANDRLLPGAQVISDTFGSSMGKTENTETPLAVAGRVLVYTYQPRENYHAGMAVCSAPDGTIDIMTREEIREYPDCIIGIVSEIPQYEEWGTGKVKINGRIWIKVK